MMLNIKNLTVLSSYVKKLDYFRRHSFNKSYSVFSHDTSIYEKLNEKTFTVHPGFGKLLLKSQCDCVVKPADSQHHPDANYVSVSLWGDRLGEIKQNLDASLLGNNADIVKVDLDVPYDTKAYCEIMVPFKYDVEADMVNNASILLESIEGDTIEVNTHQGHIHTKNVKSREIVFKTESGLVTAEGVLQGNIHVIARNSIFKAKRLLGKELFIQGGHLCTQIESSYIDNGKIFVQTGEINIKNLHGSTDLYLQNGKLCINGLHGQLNAFVTDGQVEVQVSKITEDSLIQINNGTLCLSLLDVSNQDLEIFGPSVNVSTDLISEGTLTQEQEQSTFKLKSKNKEPLLKATLSKGKIEVSLRDWFTSLGIK